MGMGMGITTSLSKAINAHNENSNEQSDLSQLLFIRDVSFLVTKPILLVYSWTIFKSGYKELGCQTWTLNIHDVAH